MSCADGITAVARLRKCDDDFTFTCALKLPQFRPLAGRTRVHISGSGTGSLNSITRTASPSAGDADGLPRTDTKDDMCFGGTLTPSCDPISPGP